MSTLQPVAVHRGSRDENVYYIHDGQDATTEKKYSISARLHFFTWAWYLPVMGTGGIAIQLHSLPFRFHGLTTLGVIPFIMSLVFFCLVTGFLIMRFFRWKHAFRNSVFHPNEGLFSPTILLSCATILINTCNYGVPKVGDTVINNWLSKAIEVCFWIYTLLAIMFAIVLPYLIISREEHSPKATTPAWALPILPCTLVGSVAAAVSDTISHDNLAVILCGILLQGFGILISLMIITLFLNRLMIFRFPPQNLRPGMFLAAGPPGFTAFALLALGRISKRWLESTEIDGEAFYVACFLGSMLFWGLSGWWILLSALTIIAGIFSARTDKNKAHFQFHLTWWAFLFPNTGFITSTILFGTVLNSRGIHIFATVLVVLEVIIWLFLLVQTPLAVYRGYILYPGKDENAPTDAFEPLLEEKRL